MRQVSYWAAQGYLPHAPRDPERYSGEAADMALLVRQGRDQGLTLRHAVRAVSAEQLRAARARLAQAERGLRAVRAVVEPLTPPLAAAG